MRSGMQAKALAKAAGALAVVGALAPAAWASLIPTAIYSEVASSPTSQLGGGTIESIDRAYRSSNGQHWVLRINLLAAGSITAANDDFVVRGGALGNSILAQQGVTLLDGTRTADADFQQRLSVNDSGNAAFSGSLSGATTDDGAMFRLVGSTFSVHAREGTAIPAIPGSVHGASASAPNIDNLNRVAYRTFGFGATATNTAVLRNDGALLDAQKGVTSPAGQQGTPGILENLASGGGFNQGNFHVDGTGTNFFYGGDTTAATTNDTVVVFNGNVVLQEGFAIPGATNTSLISSFNEIGMTPNSDWWARGSFAGATAADSIDFVVASGTVVALTGDTVTPSSTERWASNTGFVETFFLYESDGLGNFIVGGVTDNADASRNAVLVYNGVSEILREGDAVDLDGNGALDDGVFINTFGNDDLILADNSIAYLTVTLRDATGTNLGDAFISVTVPTPGAMALLGLGGLLAARRRR